MDSSPLHFAVSLRQLFPSLKVDDQLNIVNRLLTKGASVNAQTKTGATPLHLAVFYNNKEVVSTLLKFKANVNTPDQTAITPLHLSVSRGNAIFNMLLTSAPNVGAQTNLGATPLHFATYHSNIEVVDTLLKLNADPNVTDVDGMSPLHIAVIRGSLAMTKLLVRAHADVNAQTSVHTSYILDNRYRLPEPAIRPSCDITSLISPKYGPHCFMECWEYLSVRGKYSYYIPPKSSVLHIASLLNHLDIVDFLLKQNARIDVRNYKNDSVLHYALSLCYDDSHIDLVEFLLKNNADANAENNNGEKLLLVALNKFHNNKKVIKLLISYGAKLNESNSYWYSPLVYACQISDYETVEFMLKHGAKVHTKDANPLHYAAMSENGEKIVELLIKYGSDVNARNEWDHSALYLASTLDIVRVLVKSKADVNMKNGRLEETLLHWAVRYRHQKFVDTLLEFNADVNVQDREGNTPLHYATDSSIAAILLDSGANVNLKNKKNLPPYHECIISPLNRQFSGDKMEEIRLWKRSLECVFVKHFTKLKVAGFFLDIMNLHLINNPSVTVTFKKECEYEISRMKENIGVSNVSFYDILTKCSTNFALKNDVVQALKSKDIVKSKYPLYGCLLNWKLIKRIVLLSDGMDTFRVNIFDLPSLCTDKIFDFLSDEDLEVLVRAYLR